MKKLRGRPDSKSLPLHRERLLQTASDEFLEKGYDGASLDAIAARAGVSKVTIYRRFDSKAGLFEAVALRSVEKLRRRYQSVQTHGRSHRDVLMEFAIALYEGATRRETAAVMQLAIAEMKKFPAVAQTLWNHRFETLAPLHKYLAEQHAAGLLKFTDPWAATMQFSGMVSGGIGSVVEPPIRHRAARKRWVESAVSLFLDGCRTHRSRGVDV